MTRVDRVALVPGVLALLPEYAGLVDPVAELREACLEAVTWLGDDVEVRAGPQGSRVAQALLDAAGVSRRPAGPAGSSGAVLVVGNGSATRTEKAPGYLDERAEAFDAGLGRCLRDGLWDSVGALDVSLARELWADVEHIVDLARLPDLGPATVDYDDAPFGVQYWVMRWTCGS